MSSTVSSRAPSPSPSLMSIIYPGLKPIPGIDSIPSTPQLGHRTLHTSPSANLFQPIPTSSSSQSLGVTENSAAPQQSTLVTVAARQPLNPQRTNKAPSQEDVCRSEVEADVTVVDSALSSHSSPVHSPPTRQDASIHQRSRSNEIDYGLSSRPKASPAFSNFPDPAPFRPLSVDSAPLPVALITHPAATSEERVQLGSAGSTWLKDESISNFFGESENIEQYLKSEEPLHIVTDC